MVVTVKIQDPSGNEIGQFEAEDYKNFCDMAAMHGIEILQSCSTGFCGVCLCDIIEGADSVDIKKTGDSMFDIKIGDNGKPEQLLACVSGVNSSAFTDPKDQTITLKKLY